MDKYVNVKLEKVKNSDNLCFSIPTDYFWNCLSEDDLLEVARMFISEGLLTKCIKELIQTASMSEGILSTTDQNYIEFKKTLIGLIDELKESYIKDLEESEMRRWWSIGRSVERIIKILFPERNISYSVSPHRDGFYIFDRDAKNESLLSINMFDWTCSINNEKVNGKDANDYFYNIREKLSNIVKDRNDYMGYLVKCREENRELKEKIKEFESRLSKYERK